MHMAAKDTADVKNQLEIPICELDHFSQERFCVCSDAELQVLTLCILGQTLKELNKSSKHLWFHIDIDSH